MTGDRTSANATPQLPTSDELRTYLAGQRTWLAWIRTGLAMMGFGFLVARFGLFLRELAEVKGKTVTPSGFSLWLGTGLVILGVAVNLFATSEHLRFARRFSHTELARAARSPLQLGLTVLLAMFGLAMAIYLAALGH